MSSYAATAMQGWIGVVVRGLVAALCLLPPTTLMGATLPAIARWVEATPHGISWLGFFYGGNIAGAVLGCLLAGFYLLRVFDMATATYVAAAINLAVAIVALLLAQGTAYRPPVQQARSAALARALERLSGDWSLGALGARRRSHLDAAAVARDRRHGLYVLDYPGGVLDGAGAGSSVGSFAGREARSPRAALGICQLLLAAAIAWTAYMLANSIPYWPIDPSLARNPWHNFQLDLVRCLWAVLPAAFCGARASRWPWPRPIVGLTLRVRKASRGARWLRWIAARPAR